MSVFKTKEFARFARRAGLPSAALLRAASAVANGHWDADLGGHVFKQRVAREGEGKSGGYRTIILFKVGAHSFFVHGFAKNQKANISPKELKALKLLAVTMLEFDTQELERATTAGAITEIREDDEED